MQITIEHTKKGHPALWEKGVNTMPYDLEHPDITRTLRTGYPEPEKSSHWGIDYFGDEILFGDDIVEIDGEVVLEENLEDYLIEVIQARFRKAEG